MRKFVLIILGVLLSSSYVFTQNLTQTVRGTILDADSKISLPGVTVMILNSNPIIGASTDVNGKFNLKDISLGRITLKISSIGYEELIIPNVLVNSGKETILNINLQESLETLNEFVVKAYKNDGKARNEMALVSVRSISSEQTRRHAGTFNDPSRILSNFAGVTSTQDGSNDIIVRGNSPKYVQWRLEGVEITNPNHFEDQNSTSGGISALNNNLLATSDFYTGAFSAEQGNVLSGIYDVKLRAGNNEKFESSFGFGLIGTDFTIEGPFKKGYGGSYILNYRYSTISLINDLGLVDVDGLLKFQDATLKIRLPTKKMGTFSIFALSGVNNFELENVTPTDWNTPGDNAFNPTIVEDYEKNNYLLNTGINHKLVITENSYLQTTLAYSGNGLNDDIFESEIIDIIQPNGEVVKDTINRKLNYKGKIEQSVYRSAITYNNKINSKNKIKVGVKYTLFDFNNRQSELRNNSTTRVDLVRFNNNIGLLQNFINWKYRVNQKVTIVAGVHNMNVLLNNKSTLEPRISANWKLNNSNSIQFGYGKHSTMERVQNYFAKVELSDGSVIEPNKDLDLLKAHHFVLGYQKRLTNNLTFKSEIYYQHLYNLPVENDNTSYYATINEGLDYKFVDLVNKGTGKNYGIELTLEKFFSNNYFFLINGSLYESKYKSLEGIERNTPYNGNYLVNILWGKEFIKLGKRDNQTLTLNGKIFFGGGRRIIPLLRDNNGNVNVDPTNNEYWDYSKAYDDKLEDSYHIVLSASYKFNRPKATHEITIDLNNLTNNQSKITEYYDQNEPNSVGNTAQFGFFPNLMYRIYF